MTEEEMESSEYQKVGPMADADWKALISDKKMVHFVTDLFRVGSSLFFRRIETTYFRPGTPENDKFLMTVQNNEDLQFVIASFPKEYLENVLSFAAECEIEPKQGSVPMIIKDGNFIPVVPGADNVYTLQNTPNSKIYNGLDEKNRLSAWEEQELKKYSHEQLVWLNNQDKIWDKGKWYYKLKDKSELDNATDAYRTDYLGENYIWYTKE
jgi:hypothetical protein